MKQDAQWNAIKRYAKTDKTKYGHGVEMRMLLRAHCYGYLNSSGQQDQLTALIRRRFVEINKMRSAQGLPPA